MVPAGNGGFLRYSGLSDLLSFEIGGRGRSRRPCRARESSGGIRQEALRGGARWQIEEGALGLVAAYMRTFRKGISLSRPRRVNGINSRNFRLSQHCMRHRSCRWRRYILLLLYRIMASSECHLEPSLLTLISVSAWNNHQ